MISGLCRRFLCIHSKHQVWALFEMNPDRTNIVLAWLQANYAGETINRASISIS
jgi:hypothetical protein